VNLLVNGVSLEYEEHGQGPALVTLHGGPGMSSRTGDVKAFGAFTDRFRVVSYDQRGSGNSQGADPYSHAQLTADLEGLRQSLNLGPIVLAGGSYGGFVALEYALAYPQNLRALILRDTSPNNDHEPLALQRARSSGLPMDEAKLDRLFNGQILSDEDFRDCFEMIQPLYTVEFNPEEARAQLERIPFRYQTHNWAFSRNLPNYNLVPRLHQIAVPTLVVVGRHDWITPVAASELIASHIPAAELHIFEHSGHSPQHEEHPKFVSLVNAFLDRHGLAG
jgi:proline-specific peptidase